MSPAIKLPEQLTKEKDNFILKLNKDLYKSDVIQKALAEDKDWVQEEAGTDNYFCLKLMTSDLDDVLDWANYLIYLNKE